MMIDITIATMGRLTKKRAMVYFASPAGSAAPAPESCGRRRLGRDRHAVANPLQPFDHDALARLEPLLDHPERVDALADLDGAERHLVARVHHGDAVRFCSSCTARCGTSSAPALVSSSSRARPYCPGRSSRSGLGNSSCMPRVPVVGSTARSTGPRRPVCGYTLPSASVSWMSMRARARRRPRSGRTLR